MPLSYDYPEDLDVLPMVIHAPAISQFLCQALTLLSPISLAAARGLGGETQAPEPKGRTVITVTL